MPEQQRLCALVVDDNADAARTLAQVLEVMGCDATFLTDPREAVREALRLKPHIAFLDIGMPHMSGYQLATELRKHFPPEDLKIVALTAYGGPKDRQASRQAGFDAHVQKPADPDLVLSIIRTVFPERT
jgi:CheY-like chemotaxis protein